MEDFNKIDSAIYDKCMALARESAEKFCKGKVFEKSEICYSALKWAKAWEAYDKKLISEEQIKYYFALGFIPEYSVIDKLIKNTEYDRIGVLYERKNKGIYR